MKKPTSNTFKDILLIIMGFVLGVTLTLLYQSRKSQNNKIPVNVLSSPSPKISAIPSSIATPTIQFSQSQIIQQQQPVKQTSQSETYCNDYVNTVMNKVDLSNQSSEIIRLTKEKLFTKCMNGFPK